MALLIFLYAHDHDQQRDIGDDVIFLFYAGSGTFS